jgi:hypothetical protein
VDTELADCDIELSLVLLTEINREGLTIHDDLMGEGGFPFGATPMPKIARHGDNRVLSHLAPSSR